MKRVDPEEVGRIAALARLRLEPSEVERLAREMAVVLERFDQLGENGAAFDGGIADRGLAARTRADEEGSDTLRRPLREFAPDWREGFFVVPRLAAHGEPSP
ncbi:MAG: aspartyl/glutamyl-tRNA amidotransferase subunit C [Gemmatimonadota bacterium]